MAVIERTWERSDAEKQEMSEALVRRCRRIVEEAVEIIWISEDDC